MALQRAERITISIPKSLNKEVENLQKDLRVTKSEIFKMAVENFVRAYKKKKLKKIAELMAEEYQSNEELTTFTTLDAEDFK